MRGVRHVFLRPLVWKQECVLRRVRRVFRVWGREEEPTPDGDGDGVEPMKEPGCVLCRVSPPGFDELD